MFKLNAKITLRLKGLKLIIFGLLGIIFGLLEDLMDKKGSKIHSGPRDWTQFWANS